MAESTAESTPIKRFHFLRTIAGIIEFVGLAVGVLSVIGALYLLLESEPSADRVEVAVLAASTFVGGWATTLVFIATGKSIRVLLAIEENTRD